MSDKPVTGEGGAVGGLARGTEALGEGDPAVGGVRSGVKEDGAYL